MLSTTTIFISESIARILKFQRFLATNQPRQWACGGLDKPRGGTLKERVGKRRNITIKGIIIQNMNSEKFSRFAGRNQKAEEMMTNKQKILSREREVAYHEGYERSREEMSRQSETHRILTIPASQSLTSREINGRMEKIPERYVIIDRKKRRRHLDLIQAEGFMNSF